MADQPISLAQHRLAAFLRAQDGRDRRTTPRAPLALYRAARDAQEASAVVSDAARTIVEEIAQREAWASRVRRDVPLGSADSFGQGQADSGPAGGQQSSKSGNGSDASPVNLPNAITLGGYGLGLWWIAGGPAWAALASIFADEADGIVAREMGQTSEYGAELDFGVDLVLGALTLRKLKAPLWSIPLSTATQIYLRHEGFRPPIGSMRAVLMLVGVVKEAKQGRY